jgi:hypothetical protein
VSLCSLQLVGSDWARDAGKDPIHVFSFQCFIVYVTFIIPDYVCLDTVQNDIPLFSLSCCQGPGGPDISHRPSMQKVSGLISA